MLSFLSFQTESDAVVPAVVIGCFVIMVLAFVIAMAFQKKSDAERKSRSNNASDNGLTQQQRDYLNSLRAKSAEIAKKADAPKLSGESAHTHLGDEIISNADGHVHLGGSDEERYDEIVGSLGEVDDEGCPDLNGIRLIAHDIAYETKDSSRDYSQIAKAMVLGDLLDHPRFKYPYGKK